MGNFSNRIYRVVITAAVVTAAFGVHAEETTTDFDYVVKVLGIEQNSQAIERLKLSWPRMQSVLAEMQGPVQEYEQILENAYQGGLRATGHDVSVGLILGLVGIAAGQIGFGIHTYGLRSYLHLNLQMFSQFPDGGGGVGAAGIVTSRSYRINDTGPFASARSPSIRGLTVIPGVGMTKSSNYSGNSYSEFNERGLGLGFFFSGGYDNPSQHWIIPFPIRFLSTDGRIAKRLDRFLRKFIYELHSFRFAQAIETSKKFRQLLNEWKLRLKPRTIGSLPPISLANHAIGSIQNLFEPSLYEMSVASGNKKCRRALQLPAPSKTQLLLPEK